MATSNRQSAPRKAPRVWADDETRPMELIAEAPLLPVPDVREIQVRDLTTRERDAFVEQKRRGA